MSFLVSASTNTARPTIFEFVLQPIEKVFFEPSPLGPVLILYLKPFPSYGLPKLTPPFWNLWKKSYLLTLSTITTRKTFFTLLNYL